MALTHQTTKMNLTLLTNDKTLRTQSESTSTDKTFASTESESVQLDTVKNYSARNRLQKRLLEIEGLMDSHELCLLDNRERRLISFKLTKATKKTKRLLNEQLRLDDEVRQRYDRLELQYLDTLRDLNSLMSSQSFASQSKSSKDILDTTEPAPEQGQENPSDARLLALKVALPGLTNQDLFQILQEERASILRDIRTGAVDYLLTDSTAQASMLPYLLSRFSEICNILAHSSLNVLEDPKGIDSDKLESLDKKDSKTPQSDFKKDESELRRLKTLIKQISSWDQLEWKIPLPGFTKDDYQTEVNRRHQLAAGVSKRHNRLDKWIVELNQHYSKYNDDGTSTQGLMTMSTKASRKATGTKQYTW